MTTPFKIGECSFCLERAVVFRAHTGDADCPLICESCADIISAEFGSDGDDLNKLRRGFEEEENAP